ncbi:hydrolase (had superfamily) [Bacillus lacus]|uniref:Hydrolase (Had superfamily) n=1 Tax=Metabacillus lacus TaxID=1983721 RepID=A0A7X2IY40_9BACI|nr:HAD family hydrolase [Metabacillus lacus]MRX71263.1 hydrolase (had superfamily) [Metabacillus lacus]
MKAFASDLDRTLIYSKKMIGMYQAHSPYEPIEWLDGEEISYISLKTKQALKEINDTMLFIPVTTRTIQQYERIRLFQEDIIPEYAITSNGGNILKNGTVLREWYNHIQEELHSSVPLSEMIREIEGFSDNQWIKKVRQADNLFIYLIIDRSLFSQDLLETLSAWSSNLGWQISLQGRKLYFVPHIINKWKAVKFLCDTLNIDYVYTAGDSLLDYDLIVNGNDGISPLHGEVLEHYSLLNSTKTFGMNASEEIVERIQKQTLTIT